MTLELFQLKFLKEKLDGCRKTFDKIKTDLTEPTMIPEVTNLLIKGHEEILKSYEHLLNCYIEEKKKQKENKDPTLQQRISDLEERLKTLESSYEETRNEFYALSQIVNVSYDESRKPRKKA